MKKQIIQISDTRPYRVIKEKIFVKELIAENLPNGKIFSKKRMNNFFRRNRKRFRRYVPDDDIHQNVFHRLHYVNKNDSVQIPSDCPYKHNRINQFAPMIHNPLEKTLHSRIKRGIRDYKDSGEPAGFNGKDIGFKDGPKPPSSVHSSERLLKEIDENLKVHAKREKYQAEKKAMEAMKRNGNKNNNFEKKESSGRGQLPKVPKSAERYGNGRFSARQLNHPSINPNPYEKNGYYQPHESKRHLDEHIHHPINNQYFSKQQPGAGRNGNNKPYNNNWGNRGNNNRRGNFYFTTHNPNYPRYTYRPFNARPEGEHNNKQPYKKTPRTMPKDLLDKIEFFKNLEKMHKRGQLPKKLSHLMTKRQNYIHELEQIRQLKLAKNREKNYVQWLIEKIEKDSKIIEHFKSRTNTKFHAMQDVHWFDKLKNRIKYKQIVTKNTLIEFFQSCVRWIEKITERIFRNIF